MSQTLPSLSLRTRSLILFVVLWVTYSTALAGLVVYGGTRDDLDAGAFIGLLYIGLAALAVVAELTGFTLAWRYHDALYHLPPKAMASKIMVLLATLAWSLGLALLGCLAIYKVATSVQSVAVLGALIMVIIYTVSLVAMATAIYPVRWRFTAAR